MPENLVSSTCLKSQKLIVHALSQRHLNCDLNQILKLIVQLYLYVAQKNRSYNILILGLMTV